MEAVLNSPLIIGKVRYIRGDTVDLSEDEVEFYKQRGICEPAAPRVGSIVTRSTPVQEEPEPKAPAPGPVDGDDLGFIQAVERPSQGVVINHVNSARTKKPR